MNLQKLNWTRLSDRGRKEFTLVEPILGGKNKCIRVCEDGEYNEEGFDRAYREICMYVRQMGPLVHYNNMHGKLFLPQRRSEASKSAGVDF